MDAVDCSHHTHHDKCISYISIQLTGKREWDETAISIFSLFFSDLTLSENEKKKVTIKEQDAVHLIFQRRGPPPPSLHIKIFAFQAGSRPSPKASWLAVIYWWRFLCGLTFISPHSYVAVLKTLHTSPKELFLSGRGFNFFSKPATFSLPDLRNGCNDLFLAFRPKIWNITMTFPCSKSLGHTDIFTCKSARLLGMV